jgi:hypothetical protein
VHSIRAALVPVVLLAVGALATGCGSSSPTDVGEPAKLASIAPATTPAAVSTPATVATPSTASEPSTTPQPTATTAPVKKPTTTKRRVFEYRSIPFKKKTVTDDSIPKGEKSVRTKGANGTR